MLHLHTQTKQLKEITVPVQVFPGICCPSTCCALKNLFLLTLFVSADPFMFTPITFCFEFLATRSAWKRSCNKRFLLERTLACTLSLCVARYNAIHTVGVDVSDVKMTPQGCLCVELHDASLVGTLDGWFILVIKVLMSSIELQGREKLVAWPLRGGVDQATAATNFFYLRHVIVHAIDIHCTLYLLIVRLVSMDFVPMSDQLRT